MFNNNRRVKPGRIKSKSRTMLSLGLAAIMLMSVPGQIILSYALTDQREREQSVAAESGYRLYADSLTAGSGLIKGDTTELLPEYKVSHVVLPDGSTSPAEEVSYSITESGDYTFEVVYEAEDGAEDSEEDSAQSEHSGEAETETAETETAETEDAVEEAARSENRSEKLTLTVTLPMAEEKAEEPVEQEGTQSEENVQDVSEETQQTTARSSASISAQSANASARTTGYDYTTIKSWSAADFSTQWLTASKKHMNYGTNPPTGSVILDSPDVTEDSSRGVRFRFGKKLANNFTEAYWLQQGAAFSDITFDFTKDFRLVGSLRVGGAFSAGESLDQTNLKADGGVTVSFIPEDQVETARQNALGANGAAYRLGAYGTLPNSIVCEYDTSTDDYYGVNDKNRNFTIYKSDVLKTGDYYYASTGNAHPVLDEKDIFDAASTSSDGLGTHYQNAAHIGISTTNGSCIVSSESETTPRLAMTTATTGVVTYEVNYAAGSNSLTFTVYDTQAGGNKSVTMNVKTLLDRLSSKKMKLAFTYGSAYLNITDFVNGVYDGDYGTIDIYANELYISPDLNLGSTDIRWLSDSGEVAGASNDKNAYYNSGTINYNNRSLWPVEGDRVYAQVGFVPTTSYMPQVNSTNKGTLKVSIGDISVTNSSGASISGASITGRSLYRRTGANGSFSWSDYTANSSVTVANMGEEYSFRVLLQLPKLTDNSYSEYYVEGYLNAVFTVGGSEIKYKIPFVSANDNRMPISRNPRFVKWNNLDYYNAIRVIRSTDNLSALTNTNPGGTQTSGGALASIHYGAGFRLGSASSPSGIYTGASGVTKIGYTSAGMSDLNKQVTVDNMTQNQSITLGSDTRYILSYQVTDTAYSGKAQNLTNNANRGISEKKRVIWNSDNVVVSSGYEFYTKPSVTMSPQDFDGWTAATNKASYYQKIAEKAAAKVFKTADYNFTDLLGPDYSLISGTGVHTGIENALANPGNAYNVTLRFKQGTAQVDRTISLTINENIKPITLDKSGNKQAAVTPVNVFMEDNGTYTMSSTFYMEGSLPSDSTATYAVYGQESSGGAWGLTERGTINLNTKTPARTNTADGNNIFYGRLSGSQLTVTANTVDGYTEIILKFTGISDVGPTGIDYRIYLWNTANGSKANNNTDIPRRIEANAVDTNFTDAYARDWKEFHVIPKVTTDYVSGVTISDTSKSAMFYEGTSFTVSGTFKLEGSAREGFDYLNSKNLIHVALYKQNPNGDGTASTNDFVIWATKSGAVSAHAGKVSAPTLSKVTVNNSDDPYSFTVSFTILNSNSSIANQWDDNAKYRIYAWTDSNVSVGSVSGLTGTFGETGSKIANNTVINTVPSVTTTMAGVLGSQVESIIHYPKEIVMMDNVKTGNKHIFSANQKITMTPLKVQQGGVAVDAEVPNPDSGVDVVIREIQDNQDAQNSIQISRKAGSADETINLTCFLGTIEQGNAPMISISGKVGTLYFKDTNNELPLYFRSSGTNPPAVADGAAFTGQIHFIFSKSKSGN